MAGRGRRQDGGGGAALLLLLLLVGAGAGADFRDVPYEALVPSIDE